LANVVLIVLLVPPLGIAGAGIALCGAYAVMLAVMYVLTRRAFAVAFEWRRLAELVVVMGGVAAAGELLLPAHGAVGFLSRAAAFLVIPVALYLIGFAHPGELRGLREVVVRLRRAREPA
jgi:O-antigen/teichoic acid export membrane protein